MAMMDNGRIRAVAVLGLAVLVGLIASSVGKRVNEILDEQFCQVYYTLPSGECSELRSRVRSEVRGNGTPTLELGNKDTQPAMVFLQAGLTRQRYGRINLLNSAGKTTSTFVLPLRGSTFTPITRQPSSQRSIPGNGETSSLSSKTLA